MFVALCGGIVESIVLFGGVMADVDVATEFGSIRSGSAEKMAGRSNEERFVLF